MRDWAENQIELILIRHGKTESNKKRRYLGRTDEPLCEEGVDALRRLQRKGGYPGVDCLFASPMKRCMETADILYPRMAAIVIPEWREMDFGAFEGKNYQQLQSDARYQAWIDSGGRLPFPKGESREAFADRCQRGFDRMLRQLEALDLINSKGQYHTPLCVGAIVHGGTIMALLSAALGGDYYDYQIPNAEAYCCTLSAAADKICAAQRMLSGEMLE